MEEVFKNLNSDFCVIPADCLKKMTEGVSIKSSSPCPFVSRKRVTSSSFMTDIVIGMFVFILITGFFLVMTFPCPMEEHENDKYSLRNKRSSCPYMQKPSVKVFNFEEEVKRVVDSRMKEMCAMHRKCPEMVKAHENKEPEEEESDEEA